eukprot:SRR837773.2360.p1 GENE.SRR837773.2360~~SRR837773.2360.p1  ORF type:complete len:325 (+),score=54.09 SRR837773.2360:100-975(+)
MDDVADVDELARRLADLLVTTRRPDVADAVAIAATHAKELAFHRRGCRVIQKVLDIAPAEVAGKVASALRGCVSQAARSPFAHFVLERLVYQAPSADTGFIAAELLDSARAVAQHIYGRSVIVRLLEFSGDAPVVQRLASEVVAQEPATLCCHKFGFQVAVAVFSNGTFEQQAHILRALRAGLQRFARHRFASQVLEHVLLQGAPEQVQLLVAELLCQPGSLASLACHSFGVNVVRALLEHSKYDGEVLTYLLKHHRRLSKDKYGASLLDELHLGRGAIVPVQTMAVVGGA